MLPLKVLLVEDDPGNLQIASLRLLHLGHEVVPCENGAQAQAACLADGVAFDLAVVDMWMPGMCGNELIAWMRAQPRTADVAILVVTAAVHAMAIPGADAVIAKPYQQRELEAGVAAAMLARPLAR